MGMERIPFSLKVVAFLFILSGISSAIEMILAVMRGNVSINAGVFTVFVGAGLLRLSRGWRTCALVLLWIVLVGLPIIAVLFMTSSQPLSFKIFGQKVGHASPSLGVLFVGALFVLTLWQYRVLTSPEVRKLFGLVGD